MKLLLDTQIVIWLTWTPDRLPSRIPPLIQRVDQIYVSAASVWEIAIKVNSGKLDYPVGALLDQIAEIGADLLDMTAVHALEAGALPPIHADPFDRMLVAQARVEGLTLVTVDRTIPRYDVSVLAEG